MTLVTPSVERELFPPILPIAPELSAIGLPEPLRAHAELGVLDITEFFGETSGGVRTYLLQKARYVESRPFLRQVLALPGPRDAITETDGVRCYRLKGPRVPRLDPYRFVLATASIRRIVRHERPSLVEIGSPFLVPWIVRRAARRTEIPFVCFFHSNFPRLVAPFAERARGLRLGAWRLARRYARRLDRLFEVTICASDYARRELASAGIDRVAHVPLGVDLVRFSPERRADAAGTRRLHGLPDGPLAGFVGRFAPEKELDTLVDAWRSVGRRTGATLVLVGDGPLRARLAERGRGSRIVLLPYQRDRDRLADLVAAFDMCVAPGSTETFGLAGLEAMASGTPVLSADRGGIAELVERSGAGALFEAGDSASLAASAVALLSADRGALGARGRAWAEREHDWATVFDRIFDVYRGVLRGAYPRARALAGARQVVGAR
jgi:alpha-1,6-mannosyltransferase